MPMFFCQVWVGLRDDFNGIFRSGFSCVSTEIILSCSDQVAVGLNFLIGFGTGFVLT